MNKFITLALFALCATMAHGQVIYPAGLWSNGQQNSNSGSSASANADASSSTNSNSNNQLAAGIPSGWAGYGPWLNGGYAAPIVAPMVPQTYVAPINAPWVQPGYPVGPVGPVGPCGQGMVAY